MKRLDFAVIGCGKAAQYVHIPLITRLPQTNLKAVADVNTAQAKRIARQYRTSWYQLYKDLINKEKIDAVVICTPPAFHAEIAEFAAENRVHILCEKPIAMNTSQARAMISKARKYGVRLAVGYFLRYQKNINELRKILKEGFLEEFHEVESFFIHPLPFSKELFNFNRSLGGGVLFELGCHHVDLLRFLFGDAKPNDTWLRIVHDIDVRAKITLSFNDNLLSHTMVAWDLNNPRNLLKVKGKEGAILADLTKPAQLSFSHKKLTIFREHDLIMKLRGYMRSPYEEQLNHFVDCITNDKDPLTSGEEALKTLCLVIDIYKLAGINYE